MFANMPNNRVDNDMKHIDCITPVMLIFLSLFCSVPGPDPDPYGTGNYVFGPPGSVA